jgi:branched-chain amino acid transport system substrate-binding protein
MAKSKIERTSSWFNLNCFFSYVLLSSIFILSKNLYAFDSADLVDGVSNDQIILGQSAAFQGASAALGIELWRGAMAYFDEINKSGGVFGRKIEVIALDDSYDSDKTLSNTIDLITKDKVFALFGYVGTPTLVKSLPAIAKFHRQEDIYLFSNFTGAQPQREPPSDKYVFNVRSSYREETAGIVNNLVKLGYSKIGLFVQNDAYGRSGSDGTERALSKLGLKVFAESSYSRGASLKDSMNEQANLLNGADAIISISSYQAAAAFIRDSRRLGFKGPIAHVSFVGAEALLATILDVQHKENLMLDSKIIVSQVVPNWKDVSYPLVKEYQTAISKHPNDLPPILKNTIYNGPKMSFGSLEGFLNAKIFVEILKKIPKGSLSRKTFQKYAESSHKLDVGLLTNLGFSYDNHQASKNVFFTTIQNKSFETIKDWNKFKWIQIL